jgi:hypothetical protein
MMARDVRNYTPSEMARSLARMSLVADKEVIKEDEFTYAKVGNETNGESGEVN